PTITSFSATPSVITSGQASTLSWIASGTGVTFSLDNGIGSVSTATSRIVSPSQTATYTLTATNSGGSAAARVTVTVNAARDTQPPQAPILTSAAAKSSTEIDLVWSASS